MDSLVLIEKICFYCLRRSQSSQLGLNLLFADMFQKLRADFHVNKDEDEQWNNSSPVGGG
jgi:hypothetical protein